MSQLSRSSGFVLHGRRFRENSRLLDVFTRNHGKIALVARVSKTKATRALPAMQPYTESVFQWRGSRDLQSLQSADLGRYFQLPGDKGICGLYCNELMLYLTERHLPMPELYDSYCKTLQALESAEDLAVPLRHFEASLLEELGLGFDCTYDGITSATLMPGSECYFHPETGFTLLQQIDKSLNISAPHHQLLAEKKYTDPAVISVSRRLFGVMIQRQLAGKTLKSRELMQSFLKYRTKS